MVTQQNVHSYQTWLIKRKHTAIGFGLHYVFIGFEFSIVLVNLWLYIETLVQPHHMKLYYSLISFSYIAISGVLTIFIARYADRSRNIRFLFFFTNSALIIGNLIYTLHFSPWLLILGRSIASVGFSQRSIVMGEMARCYTPEDLTKKVSLLSMVFSFGFLSAPGMNILFEPVDFYIGNLHITFANASGLYVSVIFIVAQIISYFFIHDLSKEYDLKAEMEKNKHSFEEHLYNCFTETEAEIMSSSPTSLARHRSSSMRRSRTNSVSDVRRSRANSIEIKRNRADSIEARQSRTNSIDTKGYDSGWYEQRKPRANTIHAPNYNLSKMNGTLEEAEDVKHAHSYPKTRPIGIVKPNPYTVSSKHTEMSEQPSLNPFKADIEHQTSVVSPSKSGSETSSTQLDMSTSDLNTFEIDTDEITAPTETTSQIPLPSLNWHDVMLEHYDRDFHELDKITEESKNQTVSYNCSKNAINISDETGLPAYESITKPSPQPAEKQQHDEEDMTDVILTPPFRTPTSSFSRPRRDTNASLPQKATYERKPSIKWLVTEMLTHTDTCLLLALGLFENFYILTSDMIAPMIIVDELKWPVSALNGILLGEALASMLPCSVFAFKKFTDRQMFYIAVISIFSYSFIALFQIIFVKLSRGYFELNIVMFVIYCLLFANVMVIKDVFLGVSLVKMVSSKYQSLGDSIRTFSSRIGSLLALMTSPYILDRIEIINSFYIAIILMFGVLLVLRRRTLKSPTVIIY